MNCKEWRVSVEALVAAFPVLGSTANVVAVYLGGSRQYGCARPDSDWDLRVVVEQVRRVDDGQPLDIVEADVEGRALNVTVYSWEEFEARAREHELNVLLALAASDPWLELRRPRVQLEPALLKAAVFRKANSLFHRAKQSEWPVVGAKLGALALRLLVYGLAVGWRERLGSARSSRGRCCAPAMCESTIGWSPASWWQLRLQTPQPWLGRRGASATGPRNTS